MSAIVRNAAPRARFETLDDHATRGTPLRWAAIWLAVVGMQACSRPRAVPAGPELVGDPLGDWRRSPGEAFARNIWDLQTFRGRIFLGYGDAIVNTGPTDVIAYDPIRAVFEHEVALDEEAILQYRVFGDRLFVPGADAVDSNDGTLYVRGAAAWTKLPLPQVAHALDVTVRGAEICVVVQDRIAGAAVRCTRDEGGSWQTFPSRSWRSVSLFQLGGAVYVSSYDVGVRRLDGGQVDFVLPGVTSQGSELVTHATTCGDDVVFIAARIRYVNDTVDRQILGLFRASVAPGGAITVTRSDLAGTPSDVFVHARRCYAVTNHPRGEAFDVAIYELTDDRTWRARTQLTADAMARSGELLDGFFYLGLGCDPGHCTAAAGRILRITAAP